MKKIVKIVGIGHMTGKKRDGSPYDFWNISYTFPNENVVGVSAGTLICPPESAAALAVGDDVSLYTAYSNGREYLLEVIPNA